MTEHAIYAAEAILDYPQSGERFRGRATITAQRGGHPADRHFTVIRIVGGGDLWVSECIITYDGVPTFSVSVIGIRGRESGTRDAVLRGHLPCAGVAGRTGRADAGRPPELKPVVFVDIRLVRRDPAAVDIGHPYRRAAVRRLDNRIRHRQIEDALGRACLHLPAGLNGRREIE